MQKGEDYKENLGTLKLIKQGKSTTRREEQALIAGDTISFSCLPGETIDGSPGGARGAIGIVTDLGTIVDAETGSTLPNGCIHVTYTVIGKVTNPRNGMPIEGVKVVIGDLESTTSAAGIYDIEGVPDGPVAITGTKSGFYDGHVDNIQIFANTEVGGLADFTMVNDLADDEWVVELKWDTDKDLDLQATWASETVFFGRQLGESAGITVKLEMDASEGGTHVSEVISFSNVGDCTSSNVSLTAYYCHVELKVKNDDGLLKDSGAIATLYHGTNIAGEFKIGECLSAVTDDEKYWHVFTLNSKANTLLWTCNGVAGGASLLQEAALSIPGKQSSSSRNPPKQAIDYTKYVGPFPGRFFRHSIKRSKNQTVAKGNKLRAGPVGMHNKAASLASFKTPPKPSTKSRPFEVSPTDPNWRVIQGKVTNKPREVKAAPAAGSESTAASVSHFTTGMVSTSTSPTDGDVSLKVDPSEVDVRPQGDPQSEHEKKISPHF